MVNHAALVQAVGDYAQALLTDYDIGTVLYGLTDHVTAVLGADGAGVSLAEEGRDLACVAATDGRIAATEEAQVARRQGPCRDAYQTGELIAVADLEHEERWPAYRATALEHGVRAVLAVPMPVAERRIGALDIYRQTVHEWDDTEQQVARVLADMASGYVINAGRLEQARTLTQQLQHALDSRIIVEQAKGILAERNRVSTAEAFERIRKHARATSTRVHEIARQIVDGTPNV